MGGLGPADPIRGEDARDRRHDDGRRRGPAQAGRARPSVPEREPTAANQRVRRVPLPTSRPASGPTSPVARRHGCAPRGVSRARPVAAIALAIIVLTPRVHRPPRRASRVARPRGISRAPLRGRWERVPGEPNEPDPVGREAKGPLGRPQTHAIAAPRARDSRARPTRHPRARGAPRPSPPAAGWGTAPTSRRGPARGVRVHPAAGRS